MVKRAFLKGYNMSLGLKGLDYYITYKKNLQAVASHSPFGLNFTEDIAFVCPDKVNLME